MEDRGTGGGALLPSSLGREMNHTRSLAARTWRTVVLLVAACVLFVGTLSAAAVFVASKAAAASPAPSSAAETRDTGTKKPLSI